MSECRRVLAVAVLGLLAAGCTLPNRVNLGVPFSYWLSEGYCGAAAVYMWSRYDRFSPTYTQKQIGDSQGITGISGTSFERMAEAARDFTYSGRDAEVDYAADETGQTDFDLLQPKYFARQVTSMENDVPVIVNINGLHSGIINGGTWVEKSGGLKQWDTVNVHDPDTARGPDQFYGAGAWTFANCGGACAQVISRSAWQGFDSLASQASDLLVRGRRDWNTSIRFEVERVY